MKLEKAKDVKPGGVVKLGKSHSFKVPRNFRATVNARIKKDGSVSKSTWVMLKPVEA